MQDYREQLHDIRTFPSLVRFLRDDLDWPIDSDEFEDITFDYTPEELGIDPANAAKIEKISRLRPLSANQPWGIFFVEFEPKRLPVVALRRILSRVVLKKRESANAADRPAWSMDDLLFISNFGDGDDRQLSFAHFSQDAEKKDLPTLKVLGWDSRDTALHLDDVAGTLTDKLAWPDDPEDVMTWRDSWRSAFTLRHGEVITTSKDMAVRLAELARDVRERIDDILAIETGGGPLRKLMAAFREALVHDLDAAGFADMYAQTIAYGLLSARIAYPSHRTADGLVEHIPVTNPFLKELMETFLRVGGRRGEAGAGIDFDELGVSEVVDMLDRANMEAVVRDFGDRNPQEDPVIHFYELFLKEYDPEQKAKRGVFYTPRPIVSYIVRSVDELLRIEFGLADGLADTTTWGEMAAQHEGLEIPEGMRPGDPFVCILDPATGTGTFLVEVIGLIHETMTEKWTAEGKSEAERQELWNEYVPVSLLPRLHGYELLMAPYAIAHVKIGLKLYETGYRFASTERARIYLTNALEPAHDFSDRLAFDVPALAHEAQAVNAIKRHQRFTVVIGNPPYSKMSGNLSESAMKIVEPFRFINGERIRERGALAFEINLQDDYVKFWAFLSAALSRTGWGIGSLISNSRYLTSRSLRGMRWCLQQLATGSLFVDLGGQVSERHAIQDIDENVFDIEQGVAIGTLFRKRNDRVTRTANYERVTGTRERKYQTLSRSTARRLAQVPINPRPPHFRFAPTIGDHSEFDVWRALDEIMPFNSGSIITSRDNLAIDLERDELLRKIDRFASSPPNDEAIQEEIGFSIKAKWHAEACKSAIRSTADRASRVRRILYRPFDERWVYYDRELIDTLSWPVCSSVFDRENLVLLTPGINTTDDFCHVLVSRTAAEKKSCSHDRATQMFPLHQYGEGLAFGEQVNFSSAFLNDLGKNLSGSAQISPTDVFGYIYAVLHSPNYRSRYGSKLRDAYPHIPITTHNEVVRRLAQMGNTLTALHLLQSPQLDAHVTWLAGSRPFQVEKVSYEDSTVWIDKARTKGFAGVPAEVWNFHIGGYQVCEKWLKDRQARGGRNPRPGRMLTDDDIEHYQKIVVALNETIRIMGEIDEVIERYGGWPGAFVVGETEAGEARQD